MASAPLLFSDYDVLPREDCPGIAEVIQLHEELIESCAVMFPAEHCHARLAEMLFDLAFPDDDCRWEFAERLAIEEQDDCTLRVWIGCGDSRWSALPWEYLKVPDEHVRFFTDCTLVSLFLALHLHLVIVREVPHKAALLPIARRPKVLVAWANPGGRFFEQIKSLEKEGWRVRKALEELGEKVEVLELPHTRKEELLAAIKQYRPDVVHFCGHGHHPKYGPAEAPATCARLWKGWC